MPDRNIPVLLKYIGGYLFGFVVFLFVFPLFLYGLTIPFPFRIMVDQDHLLLVISMIFGVAGLVFVLWSNLGLLQRGRGGPIDLFNIPVTPRTSRLVTTGPYRYTRNPMAFGILTTYIAWAVYLDSLAALMAVILSFFFVAMYLKMTEERRLLKDFGNDYEEYRSRVSMIIPWLTR